jgi:hypothetical protein
MPEKADPVYLIRHFSKSVCSEEATEISCDTDSSKLTTLSIASQPEQGFDKARKFAATVLIIREMVSLCRTSTPMIDEQTLTERLSSYGALVTASETRSLTDMMRAGYSETNVVAAEMAFIKKDAGTSIEVGCSELSTWLKTETGEETASIIATIHRPAPLTLYEKAQSLYCLLLQAEKFPAGAERATTMTIAIQNEWDRLIERYLVKYLEAEPNGSFADAARKLLEEVRASEFLAAMASLRPALLRAKRQ